MTNTFKVVNLNIHGRNYPVKCNEQEAIRLKSLEKSINERLQFFKLEYAQLDKQDCLSMALIEAHMVEAPKSNGHEPLIDEVILLKAKLSAALS